MKRCWPLAFLLLLTSVTEAGFGVGVGVNVGPVGGEGGGGGSVWIGGGINNSPNPTSGSSSSSGLTRAYTALQAWKSAISDDPAKILDTWDGPDVCSYKGVFCAESEDGQTVVAGIDLNHANLKGTLVKELSFLSETSLIHLNSNRFSGSLPDSFRDLNSLQELDLSNNQFSGPFPRVALYLQSLIYLDLRFNNFTGSIPEELFNKNLDAIFLNNNQFEGEHPQSLGNAQTSVINLANNKFSGNLPSNFGFMGTKLKEILFLNNQLTGCIPEGVGLFSEIQVFDVSFNSPQSLGNAQTSVINLANNKFSGNLPSNFGFMGTKLKEILFLNNQLTGCIPEGVGLFSEIQVFDVSFNSLMGHLPDTISCLQQIEVLNLAHNKLSGVLPDLVCSLKSLVNLTVAYNFFSGFSQECNKLFYRNVGFDFSLNCIPGRNMQRPQPQCSLIPGGGLNCLRIPGVKPLIACGSVLPSSSPSSSSP